jgi:hypothetical protein
MDATESRRPPAPDRAARPPARRPATIPDRARHGRRRAARAYKESCVRRRAYPPSRVCALVPRALTIVSLTVASRRSRRTIVDVATGAGTLIPALRGVAGSDGVVLAFVLFMLPDARVAVAEAARVLRTGGWLLAATWGLELEQPRMWSCVSHQTRQTPYSHDTFPYNRRQFVESLHVTVVSAMSLFEWWRDWTLTFLLWPRAQFKVERNQRGRSLRGVL